MSKEMIEPTEFQRGFRAGYDEAMRIRDALRASAVAEPEPHDPSQYCRLDACKREGCTRLAHMCLSKQPHPTPAAPISNLQGKLAGSPAAPIPASVREDLAKKIIDRLEFVEGGYADMPDERYVLLSTDERAVIRCALSSLPAPAAAPTIEKDIGEGLGATQSTAEGEQMIADILAVPEAAPTREEIISIVEEECFLNDFSPVEKTKSRKTLWRVGNVIRERILALKSAPASEIGRIEVPAPEILRRAAELVAAGWSPLDKPLNAAGDPVPIFGGTTGDTARAGINRDITHHTLYSAIVTAYHERDEVISLGPLWMALNAEIMERFPHRPGGNVNFLHPIIGFNVTEGRTSEQLLALLNHVADQIDPSKPKAVTPLPPVTL